MSLLRACCVACLLFILYAASPVSADGVPVAGAQCFEEGQTFHNFTGATKSPWEIDKVYAVPIGTLTPETWPQSATFEAQLQAILEGQTPELISQAITSIWPEFFTSASAVLISFRRTITANDEVLTCQSDIWTIESYHEIGYEDHSGWLEAGEFVLTDPGETQHLSEVLSSLLESRNSQPGAQYDE